MQAQLVQRRGGHPCPYGGGAPATVRQTVRAPGRPLDPAPRVLLERRFGADLGSVRIHTDSTAAESARDVHAQAYTVGEHIAFATGRYEPHSSGGLRLLTHELTHVLQQRAGAARTGLTIGEPGGPDELEAEATATLVPSGGHAAPIAAPLASVQLRDAGTVTAEDAASPAALAAQVSQLTDFYDPEAPGGIGDFPAAFDLLIPLATDLLLQVLVEVDKQLHLELLRANVSAARSDQHRLIVCMLAVQYSRKDLSEGERTMTPGLVVTLPAGDQAAVRAFLAPLPAHKQTMFLGGAATESERLAALQLQFLEQKRQAAEAAARDKAVDGVPASTVTLSDAVEEEVELPSPPPSRKEEWTKLLETEQNAFKLGRAPAVITNVLTSIKGTPLEQVMKGRTLRFEPENILKQPFPVYAYQDGSTLVFGMRFVEDAEKDPRNVWPILAHEMGGHFEYGTTYASTFLDKVLEQLPEDERKKWSQDPDGRQKFFLAYDYAETEIFAALSQRQYDMPVSGALPAYRAMVPDDIIEMRLTQIMDKFPKEVGTAILMELNREVQASASILPRDKQYFLAQVTRYGFVL